MNMKNTIEKNREEKIRDIETHIRDIKKRIIENNFSNYFERGLLKNQIDMLERDIKYHQTGRMVY